MIQLLSGSIQGQQACGDIHTLWTQGRNAFRSLNRKIQVNYDWCVGKHDLSVSIKQSRGTHDRIIVLETEQHMVVHMLCSAFRAYNLPKLLETLETLQKNKFRELRNLL